MSDDDSKEYATSKKLLFSPMAVAGSVASASLAINPIINGHGS